MSELFDAPLPVTRGAATPGAKQVLFETPLPVALPDGESFGPEVRIDGALVDQVDVDTSAIHTVTFTFKTP